MNDFLIILSYKYKRKKKKKKVIIISIHPSILSIIKNKNIINNYKIVNIYLNK